MRKSSKITGETKAFQISIFIKVKKKSTANMYCITISSNAITISYTKPSKKEAEANLIKVHSKSESKTNKHTPKKSLIIVKTIKKQCYFIC